MSLNKSGTGCSRHSMCTQPSSASRETQTWLFFSPWLIQKLRAHEPGDTQELSMQTSRQWLRVGGEEPWRRWGLGRGVCLADELQGLTQGWSQRRSHYHNSPKRFEKSGLVTLEGTDTKGHEWVFPWGWNCQISWSGFWLYEALSLQILAEQYT